MEYCRAIRNHECNTLSVTAAEKEAAANRGEERGEDHAEGHDAQQTPEAVPPGLQTRNGTKSVSWSESNAADAVHVGWHGLK
eukprot:3710002-Rhodomonas_salina.5